MYFFFWLAFLLFFAVKFGIKQPCLCLCLKQNDKYEVCSVVQYFLWYMRKHLSEGAFHFWITLTKWLHCSVSSNNCWPMEYSGMSDRMLGDHMGTCMTTHILVTVDTSHICDQNYHTATCMTKHILARVDTSHMWPKLPHGNAYFCNRGYFTHVTKITTRARVWQNIYWQELIPHICDQNYHTGIWVKFLRAYRAWKWCHIFVFFGHCFRQFRGLES